MTARHRAAGTGHLRRLPRRPLLAAAGLTTATLVVAGTAVTWAAFTDSATADLGTVGGSYDIAFVDGSGTLVQGNPDPMVLRTVTPGSGDDWAVDLDVVTTTAATGPVVLRVVNARPAPLPADPGIAGPGADPFDVARFTVSVDGEVVATARAADLGPVSIDDWETDVPRRIHVAVALEPARGNPYYFGRDLVLGLRLDGSTA